MNTITIYGIRHIKTHKALRISIFSNEGCEECNSCGARFEETDSWGCLYTTTDLKIAERALKENPHWFNADLEYPEWPEKFNPFDYEIFEIGCISY